MVEIGIFEAAKVLVDVEISVATKVEVGIFETGKVLVEVEMLVGTTADIDKCTPDIGEVVHDQSVPDFSGNWGEKWGESFGLKFQNLG